MSSKVMPQVSKEYNMIISMYRRTEETILDLLSYNTSMKRYNATEHGAIERVQQELQKLYQQTAKVAPAFIEKQYLLGKRQTSGRLGSYPLTSTDYAMIDIITNEFMGNAVKANMTTIENLEALWAVSVREAARMPQDIGINSVDAIFLEKLKKQGLVAFTNSRGANYRLTSYMQMIVRTSGRQATNLGNVNSDMDHDLYQISSHSTTCNICAPLENRVFSKSGTNPNYPPLALAFGLIDPNGPETLENSWLNIHPNCLHFIKKFTETEISSNELALIREFSSFTTNPPTYDPRPRAEIDRYNKIQTENQQLLRSLKQFERYKILLGNAIPKTFNTFLKHKNQNTKQYNNWKNLYRKRNNELK